MVKLDVAARKAPAGAVTVRQADRKGVVAAWLAIVRDVHHKSKTAASVYFSGACNAPGGRAGNGIGGDARAVDFHTGAVVQEFQVAPKTFVLDASGDSEIAPRAAGCAGDPAAAGNEVAAGAGSSIAGDVSLR